MKSFLVFLSFVILASAHAEQYINPENSLGKDSNVLELLKGKKVEKLINHELIENKRAKIQGVFCRSFSANEELLIQSFVYKGGQKLQVSRYNDETKVWEIIETQNVVKNTDLRPFLTLKTATKKLVIDKSVSFESYPPQFQGTMRGHKSELSLGDVELMCSLR
jgi:hypothetical protein